MEEGVVAIADEHPIVDVGRPAGRPGLEMVDVDVAVPATRETADAPVPDGDRPARRGAPPPDPPAEVGRLAIPRDEVGHRRAVTSEALGHPGG